MCTLSVQYTQYTQYTQGVPKIVVALQIKKILVECDSNYRVSLLILLQFNYTKKVVISTHTIQFLHDN